MRRIFAFLLLLCSRAIAAEAPLEMDPCVVKDEVVARSYPYNAFLKLGRFHAKEVKSPFAFLGFGFTKCPESTFPHRLRVFVSASKGENTEITNQEGIYVPTKELKGRKIRTNQPFGTVRAHSVLRLREGWRQSVWTKQALESLISDFNGLVRSYSRTASIDPIQLLGNAVGASITTANEVVVEFESPGTLDVLQQKLGGCVEGNSLRLSREVLRQIPKDWRLETTSVRRIYPWHSGVTLSPVGPGDSIWYPLKFSPPISNLLTGLPTLIHEDLGEMKLIPYYSLDCWNYLFGPAASAARAQAKKQETQPVQ